MAIDRAKLTKSAQKHLAKGNLDRAIGDYEKLVEDDPKDARTLLKLGDLYTKKGALRAASDTYRKVAAQYAEQGFFLKAVAVFKQILKLDPSQLDMWEKLAEMYELLSLTSEAVSTYEQVADAYQRAGKSYKALGPLGKVEKLDPTNVAASIRYAEALSKARRIDDAVAAFERGAAVLKAQGRIDDYVKVAERLLYHQPGNASFGRELAALYLERSDPKAALGKLQHCFKADPRDPATLELLGRAFGALGQTAKTVSVYRELSRIHGEAGRADAQADALRAILQLDSDDLEARQTLAELNSEQRESSTSMAPIEMHEEEDDDDLIILDDEDDSGVVSLSDSGARFIPSEDEQADVAAQVARLMNECEVFVRYGLDDKVESQLKTVLALLPGYLEARVKLADHYASAERGPDAAEQLLIAAEGVRQQDAELAMEYCTLAIQHDPRNDAAKRLLQSIAGEEEPAHVPQASGDFSTAAEYGSDEFEATEDDDLIILDEDDDFSEADDLPGMDDVPVHSGTTDAPPPGTFDASPKLPTPMAPRPRVPAGPGDAPWPLPAPAPGVVGAQPSGFAGAERPTSPQGARPFPAGATPWPPAVGTAGRPELAGEATPLPALLSSLPPPARGDTVNENSSEPHRGSGAPDRAMRDAELPLTSSSSPRPYSPFSDVPEQEQETPTSQVPRPGTAAAHSSAPAAGPAVADEDLPDELLEALEEIDFYAAQGMLDTARDTLADALRSYPGHPSLLAKERVLIPPEASSHPPSSAPASRAATNRVRASSLPPGSAEDQSFALAEKLAEEAPAETSGAGAEAIDVSDVIDQFRAGVRKAVDRSDSATHYDLGIAYMEMGLHSEAIEEFVMCLDSPKRRCQTLTMIGLSYVAKGDMKPGIEHFEEALRSEPSAAEQLDLWFEMGNAYELAGRNNEALIYYEQVEELDSEYRAVSQRIARLGLPASQEQEEDEFDTMFDNMILKE